MNSKKVLLASLVLLAALVVLLPISVGSAAPARSVTVTGTVWRDLNADTYMGFDPAVGPHGLGVNILTQAKTGNNPPDTYGDPNVPGAGLETGFPGVQVCVTGTNTCVTTDSDGKYTIEVPDFGSLTITAPDGYKFSSDDPAGDNDADQQDVPPVPPAPWTAQISWNSIQQGKTDAGLRPLPEIQISYVDINGNTNDGIQGFETGTPPFNVYGGCPNTDYEDPNTAPPFSDTPPGDDCHHFDLTVRSNDIVTFIPSVTLDNAPDNGIDNVVIEMQFTPVDGADLEIISSSSTGIPTACGTGAGYNPQSQVIKDQNTGGIILICNVGNLKNAQIFASIGIKATGLSPHASRFTTEIRAYAAANDALPSPELPTPDINISAAPRFDLTKEGRSNESPQNGSALYGLIQDPTGDTDEMGVYAFYDTSIIADMNSEGKGITQIESPFTFKDIIDPAYAPYGGKVVWAMSDPWIMPHNGHGQVPYQDNMTADSGIWNGDPATSIITVEGADTSGRHFPTIDYFGQPLAPFKVVVAGQVGTWIPYSAFFRSVDPNWQDGDPMIPGTYKITNCVGYFDPNGQDANGNPISNYLTGYEPGWDGDNEQASGNNCRTAYYTVTTSGTVEKRFANSHFKNGQHKYSIAPEYQWVCQPGDYNSYLPGQSGCDSGDGLVTAGQEFTSEVLITAHDAPLTDAEICETIDNSTYHLAHIPADAAQEVVGKYAWATYDDSGQPALDGGSATLGRRFATDWGYIIEYARFTPSSGRKTWQVNHHLGTPPDPTTHVIPVDNPQQQQAAKDCGASLTADGKLEWTTDPDAAGWDPGDIVMIRLRPDPNQTPQRKLGGGDRLLLWPYFVARSTFYSPDYPAEDGKPIPTGTLLPNVSNFAYDKDNDGVGDWDPYGYDATHHQGTDGITSVDYGDRLIYRQLLLSIEKHAFKEGSTPYDDDLDEVFAGDQIRWSLLPAATNPGGQDVAENLTITDVLPKYTSYSASCSPPPPAGVSGPTIIPNTPNEGETTLIYTYDNPVPANQQLDPIVVCTNTDPFAPALTDVVNKVKIEADNVPYNAKLQEDDRAVRLLQKGRFAVEKSVDHPLDFQNDDQVWTMVWANTSDTLPFAAPDVIEVFPYNGDGQGAPSERETYFSDYHGTLTLTKTPPDPTVSGPSGTRTDTGHWYVTGDSPDTVSYDPTDTARNDLNTGSTHWCEVPSDSTAPPPPTDTQGRPCTAHTLADVTAIRWVSDHQLAKKETARVSFTLQANNNKPNDLYVDRFAAYSATFNDPVRSNEPYVQVVGFSIGDLLWLDMNGNGKYDDGIDVTAPAGVEVHLYDENDNLIDTTTTDEHGRWFFEGLTDGNYDGSGKYVAGKYYVTVTNLPEGWVPAPSPEMNPDTDKNENFDHHAIESNGVVRSAGLMTLSATVDANGDITGDEPTGDNVKHLGNPMVRDDMTNFTLDLAFVSTLDYGDLPDSYGTTRASDGARHSISDALYLGACVDSDSDGRPADDAGVMGVDGDDAAIGSVTKGTCATANDDEDGVTLVTPLVPGGEACVQVTAHNATGNVAHLYGWFDWNGDGQFSADEALNTGDFANGSVALNGDVNNEKYCFTVPDTATFEGGKVYYRFRLTTAGLTANDWKGAAPDGEVEDYYASLYCAGNFIWNDAGSATEGVQDGTEPGISGVTLTLHWDGNDNGNFDDPEDRTYTTTTDANGFYAFCGLLSDATGDGQADSYRIDVTPPSGMVLVPAGQGNDPALDSDGDATGKGPVFTVPPATDEDDAPNDTDPHGYPDSQTNLTIDFGLVGYDFGDLPSPYKTTIADGGAEHEIAAVSNPILGTVAPDPELDGQPDAAAAGDDNNGVDDEDGVTLPTEFVAGRNYGIEYVVGNASANTVVSAWIDWNGDGDFADAGEQILDNQSQTADGTYTVNVTVPLNVAQSVGVRFRIANENIPSPNGLVSSGEVEDYLVNAAKTYDYGDLPDGYATTDANNGAKHLISPTLYLGACVDGENDGQPDTNANGDDANTGYYTAGTCATAGDDEDGVRLITPLIPGAEACVQVTAHNATGNVAHLYGWFDWNGDGQFSADEALNTGDFANGSVALNGDVNNEKYCFTVPDTATFEGGKVYYRFRLTTAGLTANDWKGAAPDGEVEDYYASLYCAGNFIWNDAGSATEGVQDGTEPGISGVTLTLHWDGNDNGNFDDPEDRTYTTTTDANGFYAFCGLLSDATGDGQADSYRIDVTPPSGMVLVPAGQGNDPALDSDGDATGKGPVFTVPPATDEDDAPNDTDPHGYPDAQTNLAIDFGLAGYDFGDLPSPYKTTIADGGAEHEIAVTSNPILGTVGPDPETDGQPEANALGDDNNGVDDEDGVVLPAEFVAGKSYEIHYTVGSASANTVVSAWIDWNGDGDFADAGEQVLDNVSRPTDGTYTVNVTVPLNVARAVGVRFRIANESIPSPNGLVGSGEVEDYIVGTQLSYDYGDLPDSFDVNNLSAGHPPLQPANHQLNRNLYLGACVDSDDGPFPNAQAGVLGGGDDQADATDTTDVQIGTCASPGDDEDGVTLVTPLIPGQQACVQVDAHNTTGNDAHLYAWFDWNGDEHLSADEMVNTGDFSGGAAVVPDGGVSAKQYCFTVPAGAAFDGGKVHMRFRLTTAALTAQDWDGSAPDGEVEDYWTPLACVGNYIWDDTEGQTANQQDDSDKPVAGLTVEMTWPGADGAFGTDDDIVATTTTDSQGRYTFCGLTPDSTVQIKVPNLPEGLNQAVSANQGSDLLDSDATQPDGLGTAVILPPVTVPGLQDLAANSWLTGESGAEDDSTQSDPALTHNYPDGRTNLALDIGLRKVLGSADKSIEGTNQSFTDGNDVAIGEIITYESTFTMSPGTITNLKMTDILTRGLAFQQCESITTTGSVTADAGSWDEICNSPTVSEYPAGSTDPVDQGRQIVWNFGTVTNSGTTDATITVRYQVVVLDVAGNVTGTDLDNQATWSWDSGSADASAPPVTVVEPRLSLTKDADPKVALPDEPITFTLTLKHTPESRTNAYDVQLVDALPDEMSYVDGSLQSVGGVVPTSMNYDPATRTITVLWDVIPLGQEAQISFKATLTSSPDEVVTNTAIGEWSSLPGDVSDPQSQYNKFSTERYYDPNDPVNNYGVIASVDVRMGLPKTGFAPGRITSIPVQKVAYDRLSGLVLEIPKLGLKLPIVGVPRNADGWDLTWLWNNAGWLEGTAFPTWAGNTALTAHVYLPNGEPGPFVNLYTLKWGDKVIIHANGERYIYEVRAVKRVKPNDISVLGHKERDWVTLITCEGFDEKTDAYRWRLVVQAVLVKVEPEP